MQKIKANIFFVGDDWYDMDKWNQIEADFMKEGIKVVYFPYYKGISTTKIKNKEDACGSEKRGAGRIEGIMFMFKDVTKMVCFIKMEYFIKRLLGYNRISLKAKLSKGILFGRDTIVRGNVKIGDYSYANNRNFIQNAVIGKYCCIGNNVTIGAQEHPYGRVAMGRQVYSLIGAMDSWDTTPPLVNIGNDVWVGNNAVIKGGVSIGDGAVVGASAVVTHDVAPYAIVAGIPAKVIKYRFDEARIRELLNIKWWNWLEEELRKRRDFFL